MFLPNTVVNFHSIENGKWFQRTLLFLKRNFRIVSIREIEEFYFQGKKKNNVCHITFDDGDITFYKNVFPLLKEFRIPVTIFLSPDIISQRKNFWFQEIIDYDENELLRIILSKYGKANEKQKQPNLLGLFKTLKIHEIWDVIHSYHQSTGAKPKPFSNMGIDEINELKQSGLIDFGAHTLSHPILKNETSDVAYHEITESINGLSRILDDSVKYFAYPNGIPLTDFSAREMTILNDAGIKMAFSTENKSFTIRDNPLMIPRSGFSYGSLPYIATKLILGGYWNKLRRIVYGNRDR
jgi:peptidoglycan/xylan/chitin deacetylase (PgdA/CDA1 family)